MSQVQEAGTTAGAEQDRGYSEEEVRTSASQVHVLSNGSLLSAITAAGAGCVSFDGMALNRWHFDPTLEDKGYFIYLRDLDSGQFWSATLQPDVLAPDAYEAVFLADCARFDRTQDGIRSRMEVRVASDLNAEIRTLVVRNESDRTRRLDVTSFIEIVLNDPEADHSHPAFSKLFVQTAYRPERHAIRAWRRLRSPDESPALLVHACSGAGDVSGFETSRPDFLGRGRSARNPIMLQESASLRGLEGSVLDPVAVLRRNLTLAPDEEARLWFVLGAGRSDNDVKAIEARLDARETGPRFETSRQVDGGSERALARAFALVPGMSMASRIAGSGVNRYRPASGDAGEVVSPQESLQFENGYGGFASAGREYVIRLNPVESGGLQLPPQPWTNVIANESIGFIVSETGAGCTWSRNSRENRLTPWFNDFVSDPHGEAFFIRDEDRGEFWSAMPGPTPAPTLYEARHGLGYSSFRHRWQGLSAEVTQFAHRDRPVKLTRIALTNDSANDRSLSLFAYLELVLGSTLAATRSDLDVRWHDDLQAILATTRASNEYAGQHVFVAARGAAELRVTTDRTQFLGRLGSISSPRALAQDEWLDSHRESSIDPCAAFQLRLQVPAHGTVQYAFLLGDASDRSEIGSLLGDLSDGAAWSAALEDAKSFWRGITNRLQIETPVPEIDLMINRWLPYQNISCRLRGRSAFYQSGGAYGYRDQLQDASGLIYLDPALTRQQIHLHASNQFLEGDVMHWWHPPTGKGIRTRFSDDLLWLPYITAYYVRVTGDASIIDEEAPFLTARLLEPGEDEAFLYPTDSGQSGSIYEHCCRAIDRSVATGAHGLPLMGTGDWNDGMNRVGREGRGESVWLGFFLYHIVGRFIPLAESRGDAERAARYGVHREKLRVALNDAGWDGDWYRRAYYDNGDPLGSRESDECRIDALAQAWAVISGAAPADRAQQALDAMEEHLVDEEAGIIRLLTPAFDRTKNDPGYIKGYVPGVRENGGQYTHGVLWSVRALAEAGRGDRAVRLLKMLSPISHALTREDADRYRVEPYVIAADVYGEPPHVGRGGWTWYTGSAAWMYRVAVESVLGFRIDGNDRILLKPSVDPAWPGYSLSYELPDHPTRYRITVTNQARDGIARVQAASVDGEAVEIRDGSAVIPIVRDGGLHDVQVELG